MISIPQIGIGTYKLKKEVAYRIVKQGLKLGYKHIDTATLYKNESAIGKAIAESIDDKIVKRDELFICTKVWVDSIKRGKTTIKESIKNSLANLKLEYLDLVLLHAPVKDKIVESWLALEEIYAELKIKYIGVSNYNVEHLEALLKVCKIVPAVNQIEITPFFEREELVNFCFKNKIEIVAHSSLTQGIKLKDKELELIAEKYHLSVAQLLLKWALTKGYIVLPRTSNEEHLKENLDLLNNNKTNVKFQLKEQFSVMPKYS